ncbi:hypothetical protein ABZ783_12955 [Micromonospora sp. NPDC047738]|uniref:hypothetical protein n=1 Tax=Micromonospora sp. NPDC047738 TaxID=3155741 RepID=UPI0033EB2F7E
MSMKNRLNPSTPGRRTVSRLAVGAVAVGTAVFGFPSASWADDNYYDHCSRSDISCQTGVEVGGPDYDKCYQEFTHDTIVCIKLAGDIVYVYDGSTDGNSAMGQSPRPMQDLSVCGTAVTPMDPARGPSATLTGWKTP